MWRTMNRRAAQRTASVLVIVLWIAFGLVSLALYFGQSMMFDLRAADNYEAGVQADQAIEAAARYVCFALTNLQVQAQSSGTNIRGSWSSRAHSSVIRPNRVRRRTRKIIWPQRCRSATQNSG